MTLGTPAVEHRAESFISIVLLKLSERVVVLVEQRVGVRLLRLVRLNSSGISLLITFVRVLLAQFCTPKLMIMRRLKMIRMMFAQRALLVGFHRLVRVLLTNLSASVV